MNTICKCLILLAVPFVVACGEDDIQFQTSVRKAAPRTVTPGDISETNPDLLTDWENCRYIVLNSVAPNGEPFKVTPPWRSGAISALEGGFSNDIKKADGWIMLFHTFCKSNVNEKLAYMCFYNRFTGYIKVLYYSDVPDTGTSTVWGVSSSEALLPQALFSESEYFSQPIDGDDCYTVWSVTADNMLNGQSGLTIGWNGFQFRVGEYHPEISLGEITIRAYNTLYTNFNFDGEEVSNTSGTITTINTNDKSIFDNAVAKATINFAADGAKKVVDKLATKYLNKKILGFNPSEIISGIASESYASAFTAGLGFIFKGFTKTETTYSVSEVNLKTHGTLTLQGIGDSKIVSKAATLKFNLNDVLSGHSHAMNTKMSGIVSLAEKAEESVELGVWNLRKKPTLYYERYTPYDNQVYIPEYESILEFNGLCAYPSTTVADIDVVFNPAIKQYIKSYRVTAGMVDVTGGNRALSNKGKTMIDYDIRNHLSKKDEIDVYGISYFEQSVWGMISRLPAGAVLNEDTRYYIDWGQNVGGNRAAVVTLTMDVDYNGKQFSFTESRVYDVVYVPSPYGKKLVEVNNPPSTFLLNQGTQGVDYYGFELYKGL
ncbi:MAG: hypothetical protein K2L27_06100 [Muribaculaceae bacterium]|nr:hypothetical protein [Muribaculaceae bacterium]